jgi:hypothetical protein
MPMHVIGAETALLSRHFDTKTIGLPRQARDKHKPAEKRGVVPQAPVRIVFEQRLTTAESVSS